MPPRSLKNPATEASTRGGPADARFFATPEQWRRWLEKNHARASEVWVGFHWKSSGVPRIWLPVVSVSARRLGAAGTNPRSDIVTFVTAGVHLRRFAEGLSRADTDIRT